MTAVALHALYAVGDRTWWGEWVAVWPPIGWLVLLTPALVRSRSKLAGGLLLLLVVGHGELPRPGRGEPTARLPFRVVTWNVAGNPRAWDELRSLEPDLVLVQESAGPPGGGWDGYTWAPGFDAAALSRYPAAPRPSRTVGPWTDPQVLLVTLPDSRTILVTNVRLVLPSIVTWLADGLHGNPREGHHARTAQFPRLARLVSEQRAATQAGAALLCGDFNSPPGLPSMQPVRAIMSDAWASAGRGWGATATADLPLARIDQCWSTATLKPTRAWVRRSAASDHRLLVVDYDADP